METDIERHLLEAYSRGELTRHEIEDRIGVPLSFGELLLGLHRHGLPLPRIPSEPRSDGVRLIRQLVERELARAG
jgi:hypothetical protein